MAELIHVDPIPEHGMVDRYYREGAKVYRVRTDLNRERVLAENEAARLNPDNLRAGDGLRWALQIPQDDYAGLIARNPDLEAPDREVNHRAWQKFMKTAEARPYMVRVPSKRGRSL